MLFGVSGLLLLILTTAIIGDSNRTELDTREPGQVTPDLQGFWASRLNHPVVAVGAWCVGGVCPLMHATPMWPHLTWPRSTARSRRCAAMQRPTRGCSPRSAPPVPSWAQPSGRGRRSSSTKWRCVCVPAWPDGRMTRMTLCSSCLAGRAYGPYDPMFILHHLDWWCIVSYGWEPEPTGRHGTHHLCAMHPPCWSTETPGAGVWVQGFKPFTTKPRLCTKLHV